MKSIATIALLAGIVSGAPSFGAVCDGVSPVDASSLVSVVIETGLSNPLLVTAPPGDKDRIFIVQQGGVIWVKQRGTAPGVRSTYLNLGLVVTSIGSEQGLLGVEFAPDFATSELFHVSYTAAGGSFGNGLTTLATYRQDPNDPNKADPVPVSVFFSHDQPATNHNGGNIQIGSDNFLYLGLGDGGGGNDQAPGAPVCGNGQNSATLLGSMIRIDPTGSSPNPPDCGSGSYTIPDGNPFADGPGGNCDEIWAIGLRNPWRWTFDPANDDLYIGDVGQECWEEVNWVPGTSTGGENYGWRSMEGSQCFNPGNPNDCTPTGTICPGATNCNDPSLTLPVVEAQQLGFTCSMTGGYVYRGCRMSNMQGRYFWGDFCDGGVNSFLMDQGVATEQTDWSATVDPTSSLLFDLTSFGRDGEGELYAVDQSGSILKIVPPLTDFEVSGPGVLGSHQLTLPRDTNWTWEDLELSSSHPIEYYSIYRGIPGGLYSCIHTTTTTDWIGDPISPPANTVHGYLVTATNAGGAETSAGPGRTLDVASCVAP